MEDTEEISDDDSDDGSLPGLLPRRGEEVEAEFDRKQWENMNRPLLDDGEGKPTRSHVHTANDASAAIVVPAKPAMCITTTASRPSASQIAQCARRRANPNPCEQPSHQTVNPSARRRAKPRARRRAKPSARRRANQSACRRANPSASHIANPCEQPSNQTVRGPDVPCEQPCDQTVDEFPGLLPPVLNDGDVVTGLSKKRLRKENKQRRIQMQSEQEKVQTWRRHRGATELPEDCPKPTERILGDKGYRGQMCPSGLALHHPAAGKLFEYATKGCPALTGKQWSREMIEQAVLRGPHATAMEPSAMEQFQREAEEKSKLGQCKIVDWESIRDNPPSEMKVSPISAVPHKSRAWRAILDLSFSLQLKDGKHIPSVNEATEKTAPRGAVDQIGHTLSRIIHAFAQAEPDAKIFSAKWDIKDGFWRVVGCPGEEWNFCYVLPQPEGMPPKIVVPTSLQMGWLESPGYFCAASETGRDTADRYAETPIGSLPSHKFESHTTVAPEFQSLPKYAPDADELRYMIEVYVDDYIGIAIPTSQHQLEHVSRAILHGIHDVFPPEDDKDTDPISFKKIMKGEGKWALVKDILGFTFDGEHKTLWLEEPKRDALVTILKGWIRSAESGYHGVPIKEFESIVAKVRHAFISIPAGKGLLSPCNDILRLGPDVVYIHRNQALRTALIDIRQLLQQSVVLPTKCRELVQAWPNFVGVKDSCNEGVAGVIIGEEDACIPTVFRIPWPPDIKADINTEDNPNGRITNSDCEMAGLLFLFLIMEDVCGDLREKHVALFSDNSPTVSWVRRMAARSPVAAQLVRALALRLKIQGCSPLTPLHIAGSSNSMTDIPSRSFGSVGEWHCKTDDDLLTMFNSRFPLPAQNSWSVYRPSRKLCMRVISILRMQHSTMDEWRRLPRPGKRVSGTGVSTSRLWDWTLTFRKPSSDAANELLPGSQTGSDQDSTAENAKLELEQSLRRSLPLARRSLWPLDGTQSKSLVPRSSCLD